MIPDLVVFHVILKDGLPVVDAFFSENPGAPGLGLGR